MSPDTERPGRDRQPANGQDITSYSALRTLLTDPHSLMFPLVCAALSVLLSLIDSGMHVRQVPPAIWAAALIVAVLVQLGIWLLALSGQTSMRRKQGMLIGAGYGLSTGVPVAYYLAFNRAAERGMAGQEHHFSSLANFLQFNLFVLPLLFVMSLGAGMVAVRLKKW
ncbi:hypothetical protein [Deinococcus marmoris]|uniref:hypothetical protein n=1 Tax=Deinococcus marmoris TaxID=249408 RepID=UPI0004955576|nr:hypothetical protein [Deinococcus marmoris]